MSRREIKTRNALSGHFADAAEAWRNQDYEKTIQSLERASVLDRFNPSIQFDLARAYGLRYQYSAAEQCLEKAVRLASGKSQALAVAGARCQEFGHFEMAKAYFQRAVERDGNNHEALITLAELLERQHETTGAFDLIDRALKTPAAPGRARVVQGRLLRISGRLEEAEAILRALLSNGSCDRSNRIRAGYELAQVLDRQARYAEAISSLQEAKALQLPAALTLAPILEGIQARVREMEETITADVLRRWSSAAAELGPPRNLAVLCGHPRSGTTLLEQVLDSHPEIIAAEETHILHDEAYLPLSRGFPGSASILKVLDSASAVSLQKARENYFRFTELFIRQPLGNRLLVDKNPALNVLIPAVARIFPEAKFIVALRDPRDVCLSCFMQPLALNPVSSAYLSLEGTVRQYISVMAFWRSILPKLLNPWIEVRYESMVENLEASARQTLAFLGAPWRPEVLKFHEHARSKPVRSPTYADVVQPVHRGAMGRWSNYSTYLAPHFEKLAPFLDAFGYR
jgi:tetratricopeptide (TPR) repeat protein